MKKREKQVIYSPVKGKIIPLSEIPDKVFSERILGDGCGVIASEGKIYSPVDGKITSIADSGHAYGIRSDDGHELLVHFGLETTSLKGRGFDAKVSVGAKVKRGDLIAEVDMEKLNENTLSPITPVLVLDLKEGEVLKINEGEAE